MAESDPLHEVIHALTRSEKRYFKLQGIYNTKGDRPNAIRLYDALEGMPVFSSKKLNSQFANTNIGKNLASEKRYLYQQLLKAMRSYGEGKDPLHQIQQMICDARWLEAKGLYPQHDKLVRRAKKMAQGYDQISPRIELVRIQLKSMLAREDRQLQKTIGQLIAEKDELLHILAASERVISTYHRLFVLQRSGGKSSSQRSEEEKAELDFVLRIEASELSERARISQNYLASMHAQEQGDPVAAHKYMEVGLQGWRDHQKLRELRPNAYKVALANYLATAAIIGRFEVFRPTIAEIRSLEPGNFNEEAEIFQNVYFYELVWKMNLGAFEEAEALVPDIEQGLETYLPKINKARELGFYYNLTVLYFVRGNWKASLRWSSRIINDERSEHRLDLQHFVRILFLILHFELENWDLLEYRIPATRNWIKKNDRQNGLNQILLLFLSQFHNRSANVKERDLWNQLDANLQAWSDSLPGRKPIGTDECKLWVYGKLHGVSLVEALSQIGEGNQ